MLPHLMVQTEIIEYCMNIDQFDDNAPALAFSLCTAVFVTKIISTFPCYRRLVRRPKTMSIEIHTIKPRLEHIARGQIPYP